MRYTSGIAGLMMMETRFILISSCTLILWYEELSSDLDFRFRFLAHLSGVGTKARPVRVQTGAFIVKHQQRCVLSFEYISSIYP